MISSIGQIGIQIDNVEAVERFYKDTIGLKYLFTVPGRMTFFECGGVRLMFAVREAGEAKRTNSIIYFKVTDIEKVTRDAETRGVTIMEKPRFIAPMPDHDLWIASFKDIEGNDMAFIEEKKRQETL